MVTIRTTADELLAEARVHDRTVRSVSLSSLGGQAGGTAAARRPSVGGGRQVELRTSEEIQAIRAAALVARSAVDAALASAAIGTQPETLAAIVAGVVAAARAESALQVLPFDAVDGGDRPFPAACCVAVNDRLIHAVPTERPLQDGDVVTVDVAVRLGGWCADVADCTVIGRGSGRSVSMVQGCREMMEAAVGMIAPGVRWSRVAAAMQAVAQVRSLGIVTKYAGHGVGRTLHEAPVAPCGLDEAFLERGDFTLLPDMVLSIEPTVVARPDGLQTIDGRGFAIGCELIADADGWTMRTRSGQPGCSVERTVLVTRSGCEVLDEEPTSVSAAVLGRRVAVPAVAN
ncbi:MAG: M24 family metallopeptidase [Planctomycetes bacterium]|nr:M24 family metallopeptidase [Planctomycetota bacterium]